ncbi:hypothetical protein HK405_004754 [Cladochytrium tenue]|nr:hypothetical protein HK405_004754 [Cladochytrium tenue]
MGRAVRAAAAAAALLAAWIVAMLHAQLLPSVAVPLWADLLLPVLPLWCLVAFGSYALASIGWALLTFGDCPEAYISLLKPLTHRNPIPFTNASIAFLRVLLQPPPPPSPQQEIQDAKDDLRRRGVTVDG